MICFIKTVKHILIFLRVRLSRTANTAHLKNYCEPFLQGSFLTSSLKRTANQSLVALFCAEFFYESAYRGLRIKALRLCSVQNFFTSPLIADCESTFGLADFRLSKRTVKQATFCITVLCMQVFNLP